MSKLLKLLLLALLVSAPPAALGQEEETSEEESASGYLPASIYPAVYVYGGVTEGITYDAASRITAMARATGSEETLEDVGRTPAFGFGFDFYVWHGLSVGLKLAHEIAPRRTATLKYTPIVEYNVFFEEGAYADWKTLEEKLGYRLQNIDYKITLKYAPFPHWYVTPFVAAGIGGNSTIMDFDDAVSDAEVQKTNDGVLFGNGRPQKFSFDYALYAGLQANLGDHFFLLTEYNVDRQFRKHKFAGQFYDASLQGFYVGAGWRFPN